MVVSGAVTALELTHHVGELVNKYKLYNFPHLTISKTYQEHVAFQTNTIFQK